MLIQDPKTIGNRLQTIRKNNTSFTQWNVAEMAGISARTYADIERGTVNPRLDTVVKICEALHITPNELLLTREPDTKNEMQLLCEQYDTLPQNDREMIFRMLKIYLHASAEHKLKPEYPKA